GGLDAGNADVELFGETAVGRAAVGGALEEEEQGEHGVKHKCECGMRNAECGMDKLAPNRHLRIVSAHLHSAFRTPHSIRISTPLSDRDSPPGGPARCRRTARPRR